MNGLRRRVKLLEGRVTRSRRSDEVIIRVVDSADTPVTVPPGFTGEVLAIVIVDPDEDENPTQTGCLATTS
jgi:hypothetical protein